MRIDEQRVSQIVERVVREMAGGTTSSAAAPSTSSGSAGPVRGYSATSGIFATPEEALAAAELAFVKLREGGVALREQVVAVIRATALAQAEAWGRHAREETGMRRAADKKTKNEAVAKGTPGPESLQPTVMRGDKGLHVIAGGPWGVICSITPSTNPTATVINNGIAMISAGNTVVFCPHPAAQACTNRVIAELNEAIVAAGGPRNLMTAVAEPTLKTAAAIMEHPRIKIIAATGGPGVVRAAFEAKKKVFAAGPGNPPVVVDASADLAGAGRAVVNGASFDNNLPCTGEKIGIVEQAIFNDFMAALEAAGAQILSPNEVDRLLPVVLDGDQIRRESIGQDAVELLRRAGLSPLRGEPRLLVGLQPESSPVVQHEQLQPFLPIVRVRDFADGLRVALQVEHGFQHTALLHSRNTDHITRFAEEMGTTITIFNGPSYAFSGDEGEGYATMTVTTPTGEGVTGPQTWTRRRHFTYSGMLGL